MATVQAEGAAGDAIRAIDAAVARRAGVTRRFTVKTMRLAVYCDYSYKLDADELYAELPFGLFAQELAPHCERLVFVGRLDETRGGSRSGCAAPGSCRCRRTRAAPT